MHPLAEKISELARTKNLFPGTSKVVVAVSGGIDSMVLLDLLALPGLSLRDRLVLAHFNHQLRGGESDADAVFVEQAANALGLPFESGRGDTGERAAESGGGLEAAARELRHSFFARLAKRLSATTVALAHHADDQVETFFLRLARGSGTRGFAGMALQSPSPADTEITLVRPMLAARRSEIEAYAAEAGIDYRDDASNADTRFLRNKIRHQLLPQLAAELGLSFHRQVVKAMQLAGDDADCIDALAAQWLRQAEGKFDALPL
ncbi:MAG: tRNA lysidine(34) synthetase TilS, partial [Verrucomicrobiota bacterium]|nr:tRNA lysidine(34) synthetase TilS [Verrucomicrobiota bacterium]